MSSEAKYKTRCRENGDKMKGKKLREFQKLGEEKRREEKPQKKKKNNFVYAT